MKMRITIILLSLLILGCPPAKKSTIDPFAMKTTGLSGLIADKTLNLSWRAITSGHISGYNIFVSKESLVSDYPNGMYPLSIKPVNNLVFPGDTDIDDGIERYPVGGLSNGVKYYVSVRTVLSDGSMTPASDEIVLVPGFTGEIELQARFSGEHDGYNFGSDKFARADGTGNDLIFYTKGTIAYLASPTRLDGFLNQSHLAKVPSGDSFEQVRKIVNRGDIELVADRVEIGENNWVLIRLSSGQHVLLQVRTLRMGEKPQVILGYTVCTIKGEPLF